MPRNAPCPCGSGRKFKRCCAGTLDDPAAISRKHDQVGTRIQAWAFEHYDAEVQAAVEEIMAGREPKPPRDWDDTPTPTPPRGPTAEAPATPLASPAGQH